MIIRSPTATAANIRGQERSRLSRLFRSIPHHVLLLQGPLLVMLVASMSVVVVTFVDTIAAYNYNLWSVQAWTCPPNRKQIILHKQSTSSTSTSSRSSTSTAHAGLFLLHATSPRRDNDSTSTSTPPLPDASDPYIILNIPPTADKKEIKRAYKRMALRYHPDVRTNGNSSEQDRKNANDDFARINAAYAFLTGKSDDRPNSGSASANGSGSGSQGYTPPHRRTSSYSSRYSSSSGSNKASVDWQDYMPKYDQEEYDAGGDSFASIFSDFLSGMGSSSSSSYGSSGGGILNDLISFLEGNFPSVGKYQQTQEDVILNSLLRDGSMEEIKDELEDAKLLVKQLEQKQMDLDSELQSVIVERERMSSGKGSGKTYMEDMRLEEKKRELEVRKEVVGEYLERARMRQFRLRKRVEELKMDNRDGTTSTNNSARKTYGNSNDNDYGGGGYSSSRTRSSTSNNYKSGAGSGGASASADVSGRDEEDEPSWKTEGFGTSRRRRSSSRNRPRTSPSSRSTATVSDESVGGTTTGSTTSTSSTSSPYSSSTSSSWQQTNASGNKRSTVPPHRRLTSRYEQVQQDKRRLREIKVDEEIEKMKKELGL